MTATRKVSTTITFLAGAMAALAARSSWAGRRGAAQQTSDPFGPQTGRGLASTQPTKAACAEGYEVGDANGRDLAITIAIFAGMAALAIGGTVLALRLFGGTPAEYSNFTKSQRHRINPPTPRLQADPLADLARFQSREHAALTTYGTIAPGLAHIPIARALTLMQGKPLDPASMVHP